MATITYKTFDVSNLRLETPVENKLNADMTKYQLMSLPKYLKDGKDFIPQIQGPWMNLSTYGIPGKNDKSGKPILNQAGQPLSDYERGRMKIPFDLTDPEVKKFYDVLSDIDTHCENQKEKIFGAKAAKAYKYAPIIRTPPEDPLAEEGAAVKPNSMTVKFDFDYKSKEIKSKVYVNTDGDRAEVATPTVDAVQKYVRYKSDFRLVFAISKFYATKAADTTDGKRKYGFGLKLKHIEVKPSSVSPQDEQENAFVEDDEDEVVERRALVSEPKVEKKVAAPTKAAKPVVEDDEEEEAEEAEEEEEEEKKPVVKKTTKAAKPVVEEEEEEEEEEAKAPPPKTAARRGRTRTSAV